MSFIFIFLLWFCEVNALFKLHYPKALVEKHAWSAGEAENNIFKRMLTSDQKDTIACYLKGSVAITMLPDILQGRAPFPSCAVVSGSGAISQHLYGPEIDSHSAVIRFNDNPTIGYEAHVGAHETMRLVNKQSIPRVASIVGGTSSIWADGKAVRLLTDIGPNASNVYGIANETLMAATGAIEEIYSGRWFSLDHAQVMAATTGSLGMLLAMANCDKVDAYEMTRSSYSAYWPFHYYDSPENGATAVQNSWHRTFSAEHDLWERIAINSDEVASTGKATLKGFSQLDCQGIEDVTPVEFHRHATAVLGLLPAHPDGSSSPVPEFVPAQSPFRP